MSVSALAEAGPVLLIARSARLTTVVATLEALLVSTGSGVADVVVAVSLITVPSGRPAATWAVIVTPSLAPLASSDAEQLTVAPSPQPVTGSPVSKVSWTKVRPAGSVSVKGTLWASPGPRFWTTTW